MIDGIKLVELNLKKNNQINWMDMRLLVWIKLDFGFSSLPTATFSPSTGFCL